MSTVVLIIDNKRELHVLNIMFQSYGFEVIALPKSAESYVQVIQYKPEYIILEADSEVQEDIAFIRNVQTNVQLRRIPLILFGDTTNKASIGRLTTTGTTHYLSRPLKTREIREIVEPKKKAKLVKYIKEGIEYEGEVEYISTVMDPSTSAIRRIEIMTEKIGELLAFPFTIAKVLNVTESEQSGAKDLAKAIEVDPVVVSSVLKVANSVLYAKASSRIVTIKDAIVRLGFIETKNIAISLSVMSLFSDEERSIGFSREEFWFHSLATAIIANKLAQRAHFPKPELAFICGLLHDFGIILLDEFFPAFLQSTLQSTMQRGISFLQESRNRWGMTHNDVVNRLFESWNLPEEVKLTTMAFEKYQNYSNEANPPMETLVTIVGVAQEMAKGMSIGRECDEYVKLISDESMKQLGINRELQKHFFDKVISEINMFANYLKLTNRFAFDRTPENPQHKMLFYNAAKRVVNPFVFNLIATENHLIEKYEISEDMQYPDDITLTVVDLNDDTTIDEITPLFSIIRKIEEHNLEEEDEQGDVWVTEGEKSVEYTPVILLGKSQHITTKEDLPSHVTLFPDELDLRVFNYAIESTILGNHISFDDLFKKEKIAPETVREEVNNKTDDDLQFKTRVINKKIIILELYEEVTSAMLPKIKNLLALALKRSPYVAIDLAHTKSVASSVISLIKMVKQKFEKKQVLLTLCAIVKDPEQDLAVEDKGLLRFVNDQELFKFVFQRLQNLQKGK